MRGGVNMLPMRDDDERTNSEKRVKLRVVVKSGYLGKEGSNSMYFESMSKS